MPFIKINSKLIIDLNVKCKAITFLKGNTVENIGDLEFHDFLEAPPKKHNPSNKKLIN